METLPYKSEPIIVTEEMCDLNGHMNVNYYYKLFDSTYTSFYINELEFDDAYFDSGFSTFTLEDNIRYLREFRLDDKVFPSFMLYKANKKLLHFLGILENEKNETAAIFETILGHIDLSKRKIVNFPEDKLQNLINVSESQRKDSNLSFEVKLFIKDIDV
tara:strand:- start:298 stop:777 length:480 start_codon:yes stop_codon:yes gene_type:complete